MLLSVVVPVYNEEKTISKVFDGLLQEFPDLHEIIVVDDGSIDQTRQIISEYSARHPAIRLICLPKNQGKTTALKTGFAATTGDIIVVQDADMEYDPVDIAPLIQPILQGKADVVYGSRFMIRQASRILYFRHFIANQFLTFFSNLLTDLNLSDVETGYKAFRGEIIRNMIIESRGFGFEIEVTAKVAKLHCRVYEVPISYYGRTYEEGKKIGFTDGLHAIFYILKYNLFVSKRRSFRNIPAL